MVSGNHRNEQYRWRSYKKITIAQRKQVYISMFSNNIFYQNQLINRTENLNIPSPSSTSQLSENEQKLITLLKIVF